MSFFPTSCPILMASEVGLQKLAKWLEGSAHECLSSCKDSPLNQNTAEGVHRGFFCAQSTLSTLFRFLENWVFAFLELGFLIF